MRTAPNLLKFIKAETEMHRFISTLREMSEFMLQVKNGLQMYIHVGQRQNKSSVPLHLQILCNYIIFSKSDTMKVSTSTDNPE